MRAVRFLILGLAFCGGARAGQAGGMQVSVGVRVATGPQPQIVQTFPADGSTININNPQLRVVFNIDMDVSKTDISKVFIPSGMTLTQLLWVDARTLELTYTGGLPGFRACRVDFADRYIVSVGGVHIPINSGYAFNYGTVPPGGNKNPLIVAAATAVPALTGVGDTVAFTVSAADFDGDALAYSWNFGDATPALAGQNVSHVYSALGVYTAIVTVSDGKGGTAQAQVAVTVADGGGRPIMISSVPPDGSSISTASPALSVNFNVDMDTTRVDISKVVLPVPMEVTGLNWTGKRTLNIQYKNALDSYGAKRVDLKDMYFINTVNEAIPEGSGFAFEFANPNHPPFIVQGPSADPGVAVAGNPIAFSGLAFDQDGDALTYAWDFGDNTTGAGIPVTHAYAVSGSYLATLTVSDGRGGAANASVLLGNLASAPWNVTRAMVGLNFKTGKDKIAIQGVADLPAGFDPTNKRVSVNVGGNALNFVLNKRGQGKTGKDSFRLTRKLKRKVFLGGAVKIRFSLSGLLAAQLVDEGLISMDTPRIGLRRTVDVSLIIDGRPFVGQAPLLYKAKTGKTGRGKLTTPIK